MFPPSESVQAHLTSLTDWHARFGHPAFRVVRHILSSQQLLAHRDAPPPVCSTCAQAKTHRLSYSPTITRSTTPLDLIFADV